jgi:hypothetical protein
VAGGFPDHAHVEPSQGILGRSRGMCGVAPPPFSLLDSRMPPKAEGRGKGEGETWIV